MQEFLEDFGRRGNGSRVYREQETKSEETIEETVEDSKYTGEKDLRDEEINRAMSKMKIKKARGMDKLSIEVWKYAGDGVKKGLIKIIRRVWKEDDISLDQRRNIVVPLYKRGDKGIIEKFLCCVQLISYMQKQ